MADTTVAMADTAVMVGMADTITMAAVTTAVLLLFPLVLAAGGIMADMAAVITQGIGAEVTGTMEAAIVLPRWFMPHQLFMRRHRFIIQRLRLWNGRLWLKKLWSSITTITAAEMTIGSPNSAVPRGKLLTATALQTKCRTGATSGLCPAFSFLD